MNQFTRWFKSDITVFLVKVLAIYMLWYIIYDLWLLPNGRLDARLVHNIVNVSAGLMHYLHYDVYAVGRLVGLEGTAGVVLVNGCSGISAMGLFAGFVIAYPGRAIPRFFFLITGIGVIYLVNVVRIMTLVVTQKNAPAMFSFTHDYPTTAIFYLVIFLLWMIWINKGSLQTSADSTAQPVSTV